MSFLFALHGGEHFSDHLHGGRSHENHEDPGENEQDKRENKFHRRLGRFLFGDLLTFDSHRIALNPQGLRDARSELVGLNQKRCQGTEIVDPGSDSQVLKDLAAWPSHLELQIAEAEFVGKDAIEVFISCATLRRA